MSRKGESRKTESRDGDWLDVGVRMGKSGLSEESSLHYGDGCTAKFMKNYVTVHLKFYNFNPHGLDGKCEREIWEVTAMGTDLKGRTIPGDL